MAQNWENTAIHFEDPEIKRICTECWGKNNVLRLKDISNINELKAPFKGLNTNGSFRELSFFKNIKYIRGDAFRNITNLKLLELPSSVILLDTCFFKSNIETIIIPRLKQQSSMLWGLTFKNVIIKEEKPPEILPNGKEASYGWIRSMESKIYVPDNSIEKYKVSESFKNIADYIHPISEFDLNK